MGEKETGYVRDVAGVMNEYAPLLAEAAAAPNPTNAQGLGNIPGGIVGERVSKMEEDRAARIAAAAAALPQQQEQQEQQEEVEEQEQPQEEQPAEQQEEQQQEEQPVV